MFNQVTCGACCSLTAVNTICRQLAYLPAQRGCRAGRYKSTLTAKYSKGCSLLLWSGSREPAGHAHVTERTGVIQVPEQPDVHQKCIELYGMQTHDAPGAGLLEPLTAAHCQPEEEE